MRASSFYIIVLLFFTFPSYGQDIISGKILNDRTGSALSGASIYFNNTSVGTLSNETGEFSLQNIPEGELIISSVGFERIIYKLGKDPAKRFFTFRLQPKETVLQDIIVLPNQLKQKYLKLFRDNFLGMTEEADMSRISNLNALYFIKPPNDKDGIIAMSDTPLTIINKKLGYTIQFDLGQFYLNERSGLTSFYGFTRYNEMGEKKKWEKNRRRNYYGSTMHFFRSLTSNTLEQEGYHIYIVKEDSMRNTGLIRINSEKMDIAIPTTANAVVKKDKLNLLDTLTWGKKMMVHYTKKPAGKDYLSRKTMITGSVPNGFRAYLNSEKEFILIDRNGLLEDPLSVFFSGYWIYEKAANLLPYNYIPEKE